MQLFVDAVGITSSGGAAVLLSAVRELSSSGRFDDITVFTLPESRLSFKTQEALSKVRYRTVRGAASLPGRVFWQQVRLPFHCAWENVDAVLNLANVGAAFPTVPQVVYCQQALPFFYERNVGLSLLQQVRTQVLGWFIVAGARRSKAIICQTSSMGTAMQSAAGLPPENIAIACPAGHPSADRLDSLSASSSKVSRPDEFLMGYVAHPAEQKNFQILLRALASMKARSVPTKLALTLDKTVRNGRYGQFVSQVERLAESLDVSERVIWVGLLPESEVPNFINKLDLFVFPSLVESFPIPLLHAMDAGKPLLLADRPYARDIAGNAAQFFDPLDPESLADAIQTLWQDGNERSRLAAAAFERSKSLRANSVTVTSVVAGAAERTLR